MSPCWRKRNFGSSVNVHGSKRCVVSTARETSIKYLKIVFTEVNIN